MEELVKAATGALLNAVDRLKKTALQIAVECAAKGVRGAEECALTLLRRNQTNARPLTSLAEKLNISAELQEALCSTSSPRTPRTPRAPSARDLGVAPPPLSTAAAIASLAPVPRKAPEEDAAERRVAEDMARFQSLKETEKRRASWS